MAKPMKKVGLNMKASVYNDLARLAKDNGQTTTYLLEKAVEHYIQFVAPTEDRCVLKSWLISKVGGKESTLLQLLAK